MLGTNDLKSCFDRPAKAIAEALHGYVDDIAANVADGRGRVPTTVLVSPIWIDDTAPGYAEVTGEASTARVWPAPAGWPTRSVASRRSEACGTPTRLRWPARAATGSTSPWTHMTRSPSSSASTIVG